jgi:hypothetical protein
MWTLAGVAVVAFFAGVFAENWVRRRQVFGDGSRSHTKLQPMMDDMMYKRGVRDGCAQVADAVRRRAVMLPPRSGARLLLLDVAQDVSGEQRAGR